MIPFHLMTTEIARQERLELIRRAFKVAAISVKFCSHNTVCSVCEMIGVSSFLKTFSADGEIRYCTCSTCGARIKAVGDPPPRRPLAKKGKKR